MPRIFNLKVDLVVYGDPSPELAELISGAAQDLMEREWPSFGIGDVKVTEAKRLEKLSPCEPDPRD